MTETSTPRAMAEDLLKTCRVSMHDGMRNGYAFGRTSNRSFIITQTGSIEVHCMRHGLLAVARSAPGGSLEVASSTGVFSPDATYGGPEGQLQYANDFLEASRGKTVHSIRTKTLVVSLRRDGSLAVWSTRYACFLAVSKPAGSIELADDFIVPPQISEPISVY